MTTVLKDKNLVLKKPPKTFEQVTISIEGNLDKIIARMRKNNQLTLREEEALQLKCCLLYLCGMPYSKISEMLNISKGKISKILNDLTLEDLLIPEYFLLLQLKKSCLPKEKTTDRIKRAVEVFIEENGDYQKTMDITGFSERTLSRYFSDPNLEKKLQNSRLYRKFCILKESHISDIKRDASLSRASKQRVSKLLIDIHPQNIVEKRYLRLCQGILIEGIDDIERLKQYSDMSFINIRNYLSDLSRCVSFLPEELVSLLQEKATTICRNQEEYERATIDLYYHGRYSYEDIQGLMNLDQLSVEYILNKHTPYLLTEEEYVAFQKHKEEVGLILSKKPKNAYVVKDKNMIDVLKPDIFFVDEKDYNLLKTLVSFLEQYTKVEKEYQLTILSANLFAKKKRLQELLTEEDFYKVSQYLDIENILSENKLFNKKELIIHTVQTFFTCSLDIEVTKEQLHLEVESLIRILKDPFVETNYGQIITTYINDVIAGYQIEKEKNRAIIERKQV